MITIDDVRKISSQIVDESRENVFPNRLTDNNVSVLNSGFFKLVMKLIDLESSRQGENKRWRKQLEEIRHNAETEPSLFAFMIRDWEITERAGLRDLAWALARDDSYATANDAKGLLELLEKHLDREAGK